MPYSLVKRIFNPGGIPQNIATIVSYLGIWTIFMLDVLSGFRDQLQILYFLPLFIVAFHNEQKSIIIGAVIFSVLLQAFTFVTYHIPLGSTFIEILLVTFTNATVGFISRYARLTLLQDMKSNYQ
jgi:hypothetical protein